MERLSSCSIRPSVRLLSATVNSHFRTRPQDAFTPVFSDLLFSAARLTHPLINHTELSSLLKSHLLFPRPSLTAPAYAQLICDGPSESTAAPTGGAKPEPKSSDRPIVFGLGTIRFLVLSIQSLSDTCRSERFELEKLLVERHLMEPSEFAFYAKNSSRATVDSLVDPYDSRKVEWWQPVSAPPMTDEDVPVDGSRVIDVEWKDRPTFWGVASQLQQRWLAETMIRAFNMTDHDLESTPMQSNVIPQQRLIGYICASSTRPTPSSTFREFWASSNVENPQCWRDWMRALHVPTLCQPLSPLSSSLLMLQHVVGEETAWRWCGEALFHLQNGRIRKAGPMNTVVTEQGDNSRIVPSSSAINAPTASSEMLSFQRTAASAPSSVSSVLSPSSTLRFLRVGAVYTTALLLSGITKTWPVEIIPPELLATTLTLTDGTSALGTAASPDYFIASSMRVVYEYAGTLYQLRGAPQSADGRVQEKSKASPLSFASPETSEADDTKGEEVVQKGSREASEGIDDEAQFIIPSRVREQLSLVLRQTLWYFHSQGMIDALAELYLYFIPWLEDAVSPRLSAAAVEKDLAMAEAARVALRQQQCRWRGWVEENMWLFPVLLTSARSQLSISASNTRLTTAHQPLSRPVASSKFTLPAPPKPTALTSSAAIGLSLETVLSGLLSAAMLWQRNVVGERCHVDQMDPRYTIRPFLQCLVTHYIPPGFAMENGKAVPSQWVGGEWSYTHAVYLTIILDALLFPTHTLSNPCLLSYHFSRGRESAKKCIDATHGVEFPEIVPLLRFCQAFLLDAEDKYQYLRTKASPRVISNLLLYASEVLESDVEALAENLTRTKGMMRGAATEDLKKSKSPSERSKSFSMSVLHEDCWNHLPTALEQGGFTSEALELLLLKAEYLLKAKHTYNVRSSLLKAMEDSIPAVRAALKAIPQREHLPFYY